MRVPVSGHRKNELNRLGLVKISKLSKLTYFLQKNVDFCGGCVFGKRIFPEGRSKELPGV